MQVNVGDWVEAGTTVATIEAMKMESNITTLVSGTVTCVVSENVIPLAGGASW